MPVSAQPSEPFPHRWEVVFDHRGQPTEPNAVEALPGAVRDAKITDLIVFAHGWLSDRRKASEMADRFSALLRHRNIPHHLDDWGPQGGHDWPYWHNMMWEYIGRLL